MNLEFREQLRILLKRRNVTMKDFSKMCGMSLQSMSNKMKRDTFTEKQMKEYASLLGYTVEIVIRDKDGNPI